MSRARVHSHYDTLRVDRGASMQRVRSAYRRLAQTFHPDKHQGKPAAAVVMAEINHAYAVLSDPGRRSAYDEWLAAQDARAAVAGTVTFTPDRFGWGGWLAFAITSVAVLTVGYVVIATWTPASAPAAVPARAAAVPRSNPVAAPLPAAQSSPANQPAAGP